MWKAGSGRKRKRRWERKRRRKSMNEGGQVRLKVITLALVWSCVQNDRYSPCGPVRAFHSRAMNCITLNTCTPRLTHLHAGTGGGLSRFTPILKRTHTCKYTFYLYSVLILLVIFTLHNDTEKNTHSQFHYFSLYDFQCAISYLAVQRTYICIYTFHFNMVLILL